MNNTSRKYECTPANDRWGMRSLSNYVSAVLKTLATTFGRLFVCSPAGCSGSTSSIVHCFFHSWRAQSGLNPSNLHISTTSDAYWNTHDAFWYKNVSMSFIIWRIADRSWTRENVSPYHSPEGHESHGGWAKHNEACGRWKETNSILAASSSSWYCFFFFSSSFSFSFVRACFGHTLSSMGKMLAHWLPIAGQRGWNERINESGLWFGVGRIFLLIAGAW